MNISITSYQANRSATVPAQESVRSGRAVDSALENAGSDSVESVSISSAGRARYVQSSAAERQAAMSSSELKGLYAKSQSDIYNFGQMIAGGNYRAEDLLPNTDDPDRLAVAQKSLDYAIGLSQVPPKQVENPFAGMARSDLSAIVYDDTGTYTDAERYAAYGELSKQDEAYFSRLYANITNGGDNREVFKGILDYFDELPPVEQSAYQQGFRDSIDSLYQEQLNQWGSLALIEQATGETLGTSSESLLDQELSSQEMLQAVLDKAIELSPS